MSGSKVVTGEFRITNQNFWSGLEDPTSEAYKYMATSIEAELDTLFESSVWSREYNGSEVVSLSPGSLMVRAHLRLKRPDVAAAQKLGSAFLRGLTSRHNHDWLGPFTVDVSSLRFAEVLVDSPSSVSTPVSTEFPQHPPNREDRYRERHHDRHQPTPGPSVPHPHVAVGWGQWGPWSACSPCSPQYDQIRTRQCRLEGGRGLFINSIEPCIQADTEGSAGDMETRSCQCNEDQDQEDKDTEVTTTGSFTTTTSTTTLSSIVPPFREQENSDQDSFTNEASDNDEAKKKVTPVENEKEDQEETDSGSVCDACLPSEVCVALQLEPRPTCRSPRDPTDPTGCGGLCAIDSEVCQALGSRAFNCHSASQCLEDEWRCADGLCIPNIKRCDGHMNCYDQSDEQNCPVCRADHFQCGNNTSCLPLSVRCDGNMDCWDGADEVNCTGAAAVVQQCLPLPGQPHGALHSAAAASVFRCRSGGACVPLARFCDGFADCSDGSDEPVGCSGNCQHHEFYCRNGRCVPRSDVCDGSESCGDGSDEQNCNRTVVLVAPRARTALIDTSSPNDLSVKQKFLSLADSHTRQAALQTPHAFRYTQLQTLYDITPDRSINKYENATSAASGALWSSDYVNGSHVPSFFRSPGLLSKKVLHVVNSSVVLNDSLTFQTNRDFLTDHEDIERMMQANITHSVNAATGMSVGLTPLNEVLAVDVDLTSVAPILSTFHEITKIRPISPVSSSINALLLKNKSSSFNSDSTVSRKGEIFSTVGNIRDPKWSTAGFDSGAGRSGFPDSRDILLASSTLSVDTKKNVPQQTLPRGWHLTSQFMPSLEDFMRPAENEALYSGAYSGRSEGRIQDNSGDNNNHNSDNKDKNCTGVNIPIVKESFRINTARSP